MTAARGGGYGGGGEGTGRQTSLKRVEPHTRAGRSADFAATLTAVQSQLLGVECPCPLLDYMQITCPRSVVMP